MASPPSSGGPRLQRPRSDHMPSEVHYVLYRWPRQKLYLLFEFSDSKVFFFLFSVYFRSTSCQFLCPALSTPPRFPVTLETGSRGGTRGRRPLWTHADSAGRHYETGSELSGTDEVNVCRRPETRQKVRPKHLISLETLPHIPRVNISVRLGPRCFEVFF